MKIIKHLFRKYKKYKRKKYYLSFEKRISRNIRAYLESVKYQYLYSITDIKAKNKRKFIIIKITTCLPGLLIGRQGGNINGLEEYLQYLYEKEVKIKIIEKMSELSINI